ncbi:unnamed protein product [Microthlaspi erraticum]|uniref:Uncharacterized protein n=1 Tax=Microthlaspi erraticum TaxID=1685480 RepID=A0A6D2HG93_9BRAS|nr:unnamed protein product [Microthlaspi erraticum]
MTGERVSAKEVAEAKDRMDRYAHAIEFMKFLEETKDEPMSFSDSWIYSVIMQVIIIGTLIPLHIHLQENNDYFYFVRYIMGMQVLFLIAEIGCFKQRLQGRVMGSISHMCGVVAIILHLRLISWALAMGIGIPLSLWTFITIFDTCFMASVADYVPDLTLTV